MRLHTAMIFVKDLPRLALFYEDLGLQPIAATRTDSWVEFEAGGVRLGLHAIPSHIEVDTTSPREDYPIKLIFTVDDLEGQCLRLESKGTTVMRRPWGAADCLDPEGNVFQLRGPD